MEARAAQWLAFLIYKSICNTLLKILRVVYPPPTQSYIKIFRQSGSYIGKKACNKDPKILRVVYPPPQYKVTSKVFGQSCSYIGQNVQYKDPKILRVVYPPSTSRSGPPPLQLEVTSKVGFYIGKTRCNKHSEKFDSEFFPKPVPITSIGV